MNLWQWKFNGSNKNASNPKPQPVPNSSGGGVPTGRTTPIEISTDEEIVWGIDLPFGEQDTAGRGTADELIRARRRFSAIGACGHIMTVDTKPKDEGSQQHSRTVGGSCFYCEEELNKLYEKNQISNSDKQRLSLVCDECARTTVSGKLSCPTHYIAVKDENGKEIYLGPDEQEEQKRNATMQNILSPLFSLMRGQEQEKHE